MARNPHRARNRDIRSATAAFESWLRQKPGKRCYRFVLYVTGTTVRSSLAVRNIRLLCDQYLFGRYELAVVDIYQQPASATRAQIIAAPTLIRYLPKPLKRIVGDLSDRERLLIGLDIIGMADGENASKEKHNHGSK